MRDGGQALVLGLFACVECATGLGLILVPQIVLDLLLGLSQPPPEMLLLVRMTGAAVLALAAASWGARALQGSAARLGLLVGLTLYNGLAAAVLAYAALGLDLQGILLWPAVLYHAALLPWCFAGTLRRQQQP